MSEAQKTPGFDLAPIQKTLNKHRKMLMKKANVVNVGIGLKEINGEPIGELALIVYVDKKISAKELFVDDLIEDKLDGVPVDIQLAPYVRGGKVRFKALRQSVWGWFVENILPGLLLVVLILAFFIPNILPYYHISFSAENAQTLYDYLIVLILGALVGSVELISRYQDEPFQTVKTWPGIVYMLLNGMVAAIVLWMMRLFGWDFLPTNIEIPTPEITRWTQVIISGLGAMALFRSSLLNLGMGENQVSVGPNAVLDVLLTTVDKEVDRFRAQKRGKLVRNLLNNIPYKAEKEITEVGIQLMQNINKSAVEKLKNDKKVINTLPYDDEVKMYMIGLNLMNYLGPDVLKQAIEVLGGPEKYAAKPVITTAAADTTASSSKGTTDAPEQIDTNQLYSFAAGLNPNLTAETTASSRTGDSDKEKAESSSGND
jgi:hypothetical protein